MSFDTFKQQVLKMDTTLKLQLEQDILVITEKFNQHAYFNTAFSRLGHMVELMGIELVQVALVEMYNRSKNIDRIVNTFDCDNDDKYDYLYFIDRSITWVETKYPHGYRNSDEFWKELHYLFREKTDGLNFDWVDTHEEMSIREVLMHNIEVKIERKPKHLKAWN